MNNMQPPVSVLILLTGVALIFLANASAQESLQSLSIEDVKAFHQDFLRKSSNLSLMQADVPEIPSASFAKLVPSGTGDLVALNSNMERDLSYGGEIAESAPRINYMDISLDKITVIAINMGRGGSAIATSNVMITPVQSQGGYPSCSALDKLR
ncbi:MAG: hypothetical protein N3G75_01020 [Methanothrix sp.]|nr:hypothetical protein [Methanothrix sp.]MCX8206401.1 hypothetical protein [Methanothrix sp.]